MSRGQRGGTPTAVNECSRPYSFLISFLILIYLYSVALELFLWYSDQISWHWIRKSRVQFPALPDFLRSSLSGTVSMLLIEELLHENSDLCLENWD
jgi:hypothetical protein